MASNIKIRNIEQLEEELTKDLSWRKKRDVISKDTHRER